jgi:hypothetical protein
MIERRRSWILAATLLLVAGCGASGPTGSPTASTTVPAGTGTAATPASSSTATPTPLAAGPAWTAVLDQVGDDGTVSKDTALQAFALAFGGLPGVEVPDGEPGAIGSGTMALRWLVSYWGELTEEQRAAAVEAIPELTGLDRSSGAPSGIVPAVSRGADAAPRAAVAVFRAPAAGQTRSNAFYTQLAQQMIAEIGSRLQSPLVFGLTIDAHYGLPQKSTSGMETGVYDANGGIGGAPAKCVIVVSPMGDAASDIDVHAMMAHETWHCYEGAVVGLARYWSQNPAPWIAEGEAEWVGDTLYPDAPNVPYGWLDYLEKPGAPLFTRAYSALGFYAHLSSAGIDPWTRLVPILEATSNEAAFTAAGADGDPFLDSWASSYLREPGRGAAWEITGPGVPQNKARPTDIHLTNGGSVEVSAPAYGNEIAVFQSKPEVLLTSFSGRARLSDANGHDYLAGDAGAFCMRLDGCTCPDAAGQPPPLPLEGDRVALGVTGAIAGATGSLVGLKLDDYCKRGITGTWLGTWENAPEWGGANGGFTLKVVQKGTSFSGTVDVSGPTCVRHGTVTGTVSKDGDVSMGWVATGVRDVQFEGTLRGDSMGGTWSAISCAPQSISIWGTWSAQRQTKR